MKSAIVEKSTEYKVGVYNEWGRLREAFVGITEDFVEPEYLPEMQWLSDEMIELTKKYSGKKSEEVLPEMIKELRKQVEGHAKVLEEFGVKVHRNIPLRYEEERTFLDNVQKGNVCNGGADFFRVIGENVILLNNLRYPFRRKQVYSVRPVLEPILKNSNARYVALPPASPHYSRDDMFLENGDILIDGYDVYIGISGNATNENGVDWLKQFLGKEYRFYIIKLAPNVLHIDTVMMFNRPGLLTYYPDLVYELPSTLRHWDKIEVCEEEGDGEAFGANSLSLDENNIVLAAEYDRLADEYRKRGFEVHLIPMKKSMQYGSGPRCLTGVLRRDP